MMNSRLKAVLHAQALVALVGVVTAVGIQPPGPVPIKVLSSNGIRAVMQELTPEFERATRHKVTITFGLSADLKRRIDAGEPFDIAILTPALVDDLIGQRKIAGETRTVLARSPIALAIRAGAPKPDIRTVAALTRTLRASSSIAFAKEGAGGVFFTALLPRLGLAEELKPRLTPTATGDEASAAVARGDAQFGVLPMSEILTVPGIEVLAAFPAELQGYAVMVAGISSSAVDRAAAGDLLKFVGSPAVLPVIKKKGMER